MRISDWSSDVCSSDLLRGDRIGLIGANGSGKTTLLKLLLGDLQPQAGEIRNGTQLQVAYFDQYRATLREDWNALEHVAEGLEFVEVRGKRKHVIGYLQDFLFTPERARADHPAVGLRPQPAPAGQAGRDAVQHAGAGTTTHQ